MNNLVQVQNNQALEFNDEQMALITQTVAKGATPNELKLFLYRCKEMGLNPLKPGQIHFVKYGQGPGSVVVGIDGFRAKAARTGKLSGIKRGAIRDSAGKLVGAWAEVYRTDWTHPAREEVPLSEYDKGSGTWRSMPETMIKKVAEAAALRMAFPDDLGGVYEQAEMDQAAAQMPDQDKVARVAERLAAPKAVEAEPVVHRDAQEPGLESVGQIITQRFQQAAQAKAETLAPAQGAYTVPFGKFRGQTLEQIGAQQAQSYSDFLQRKAAEEGKPLQGQVAEFVSQAYDFLNPEDETDLPF